MIDLKAVRPRSDKCLSHQMGDRALFVLPTNPKVDTLAPVLPQRCLNHASYERRFACSGPSDTAMIRDLVPTFISNDREPAFRVIFHPSYLLGTKPASPDLFVEGVLLASHTGIITDTGNKCR